MEIKNFIPRILDKVAEVVGGLILKDVDYMPNTGAAPLLDSQLYDIEKARYEIYDDGATSPSTYSELFEQGTLWNDQEI